MSKSYKVEKVFVGADDPKNWEVSQADINAMNKADQDVKDYEEKLKRGEI